MSRTRAGFAWVLILLPLPHAAGAEAAALDLAAAKALALQRQPAVAAARASLAAAVGRQQALDNLRVPTCLQPDLPLRRKQAALGPVAAEAGVRLAEMNTLYGVQYSYVTYLFARSQEQLADDALRRLGQLDEFFAKVVEALAKEPEFDTEFTPADRERALALTRLARGRRADAAAGSQRALSALREAIGLQDDCPLVPAQERLLDVRPDIDCNALVELALAHRPEIVQASVAEQVHQLEVAAQNSRKRALRLNTFASGSDLHAQPLPAGSFSATYSPQALGPEMPVLLAGRQCDRAAVAAIYHDRSLSVVEKVRGLVRLEVEQACLRYLAARAKLAELEAGLAHSARASAGLREGLVLGRGARAKMESFLAAGQLGSELRISVNEARYEMLLALIALERATGGAFSAGLDHAPQVAPPPEPEVGKKLFPDIKAPRNR